MKWDVFIKKERKISSILLKSANVKHSEKKHQFKD